MTYYHQELNKISEEIQYKQYLLNQVIYAKLYIDNNYAEKIGLKDIAGEARFSKFHFLKLFKKIYGVTPYQYVKEVRVKQAKILLRAGNAVGDVAFLIGFDSVTSFAGFFKKITGLSPSTYQQQQLKPIVLPLPLKFLP